MPPAPDADPRPTTPAELEGSDTSGRSPRVPPGGCAITTLALGAVVAAVIAAWRLW